MKHATRIKAFALGCALLTAGGVAAHLWGAPREARADALLAVQDCQFPPPVPVDTTVYFGTKPGTPWRKVQDYIADHGLDFDYGGTTMLNVRLCADETKQSCKRFPVRIQSEKSNVCLSQDTAEDGNLRVLGRMWTPRNTPPAVAARWGFTGVSETGFVYLLLRGTTAYAMYDSAGVTAFTPAGVWNWQFCQDSMRSSFPKGEWRDFPADSLPPPCRRSTTQHPGMEGFTEPTELASYGWMACVNGCCRFYGSPPPPDPEEVDTLRGSRGRRRTN